MRNDYLPEIDHQLEYRPALDGLRGIAVLLVLITHVTLNSFRGGVGVDIFFVLSGFLITSLLVNEQQQRGVISLGRFYLRRFLRLYPSLLIVVLVSSLLLYTSGLDRSQLIHDSLVTLTYLTPWVLTFSSWSGGMYRHTWSLGLEETFYIIFPLIFLVSKRIGQYVLSTLLLIVGFTTLLLPTYYNQIFLTANPSWASYNVRMGGLFIGCGVALLPSVLVKPRGLQGVLILGFAGYLISIVFFSDNMSEFISVICSAMIVKCLWPQNMTQNIPLASILCGRTLTRLGRCSYEIYLIHYPLVILTLWELQKNHVNIFRIRIILLVVGIFSIFAAFYLSNFSAKIINRLRNNLKS